MAPANTQADVAVLKAQLMHVRELVERNHHDAQTGKEDLQKSISALATSIEELKTDLNQRRGAERAAKWFIGLSSGSIGAGLFKLASYIAAAPK